MYVSIPLPNMPPSEKDVSLVIGPDEFQMECIFARREFEGVFGAFAGAISPELSSWKLQEDPFLGATVEVKIHKKDQEGLAEFWHAFLVGEEPERTVHFSGICEITGARFQQYKDLVQVEFIVPSSTGPPDVFVDVENTKWRVKVADSLDVGGTLCGRVVPDETAWALDDDDADAEEGDDKLLYITLRKENPIQGRNAFWWPGLTEVS